VGQRANLIVVTGPGTYQLHYTHWHASSLDRDLFWSPAEALDFILRQRSVEDGADWLDDVWAEGGAVLDPSARELLWFGGEDILYDAPLRRVHQALMGLLWPGWRLTWASEGIADLARRVGKPVDEVLAEREQTRPATLGRPAEPSWIRTLVSRRDTRGELGFFASLTTPANLVLTGPALCAEMDQLGGEASFDWAARSPTFPDGGLHIDERARRVELWMAATLADAGRRMAAAWPGWTTTFHGDRFERQLELPGVRFPQRSRAELVAEVRAIVVRPPTSHASSLQFLRERARQAGVTVNPLALRADAAAMPTYDPAERFDAVAARWLEKA
jgi:hypothetical protein